MIGRRTTPGSRISQPVPDHPILVGLLLLGIFAGSQVAVAQTPTPRGEGMRTFRNGPDAVPLRIHRLRDPIRLDGRIDEPEWDEISPLPMTMFQPIAGGEPTERTEIRLAYDDRYLYAAGRFYDSDPSGIRVNSLYRDRDLRDDRFQVILDTFRDGQNGVIFGTTPAGLLLDVQISGDAALDDRSFNPDWNAYWDAASYQDDQGWYSEIRIPFSSLRFRVEDGEVTMGLIVSRLISRKEERQLFPAIPPDWENAPYKPSQAYPIVFEGIHSTTPVYLTPYLLGGSGRTALTGPGGTYLGLDRQNTSEVGLDLKYVPRSNLAVDVTVNTDFAQVEVDDQQVNLTRFSLFFPEKRPFFQERARLFDFDLGEGNRLFYSRRIGLTDGGEPVPILAGARVAGSSSGWDYGILDMQSDAAGALSSENFGVLRLKKQVVNDQSYVGGMFTNRQGGGRSNRAFGLDTSLRIKGDDYIRAAAAITDAGDQAGTGPEQGALRLVWERTSRVGWFWIVDLTRMGEAFDPGVGFIQRTGFTAPGVYLIHVWWPQGGNLRRIDTRVFLGSFMRNQDGSMESGLVEHIWRIDWRSGALIWASLRNHVEDIRAPFDLSAGAFVPPGRYTFPELEVNFFLPPGWPLHGSLWTENGRFYDGHFSVFQLNPEWNASAHLTMGLSYIFNRVYFPGRGQYFKGDLARLRLRSALDTHLSFNAFLQYNRMTETVTGNFRLRYRLAEGKDLYLVYNDELDTASGWPWDPALGAGYQRSLLLKMSWGMVWTGGR